jgi:hypothetical protein
MVLLQLQADLSLEVDAPESNTAIIWTPIFKWYVVWCGSKNGHQKGMMCLDEIGLCAQKTLAVLGSIVNMIGGTYTTT